MKMRLTKTLASILSLVMLLSLVPVTASAATIVDSGTCGGNLTYTLDSDGTLTISGTGTMSNYSNSKNPWYPLRALIKKVIISDGVTSIGSKAFYNFTGLQSVTIGDGVTSIGEDAFFYCNISSVFIKDLAKWLAIDFSNSYSNPLYNLSDLYLNEKKVTEVTFPAGTTNIGKQLSRCTSLVNVIIPDSVTRIGSLAFHDCHRLQSVTMGDGVTSIGESAFAGCGNLQNVNIPDSVISIGSSAFEECYKLQSITIPDSVMIIDYYTFYDCRSLQSVTIPDSVVRIEGNAFRSCDNLQSVTIGDGVTSIGESAFYDCNSLQNITIGKSVTSIGRSAFSGCSSLQSVYIYDLAKWFDFEFSGNPLHEGADLYLDGKKVTDIIIPSGVTHYDDMKLSGCTSLVNVVIPDSVTYIGSYEFINCSSLQSITIPDSVKSIGKDTFKGCSNLTDVYYSGSESQWNEIKLSENDGNDYLINATKHYNSCSHKNKKTVPETPATTKKVGYTEGVYCNDCKKYILGHTEIPKLVPSFTDSSDAKVNGNDVVSNNGLTVAQLLSQAGKGAVIKTAEGKTVENSTLIGTGMILTMADGTKKEIVVPGDADGDGKISASDARLALRASVGLEKYEDDSCYYKAANVGSSDNLSAADARLILRASVGLEEPKEWLVK